MNKRRFFLSLAFLAGNILSYPPFNLGLLAWFAFLPLFLLVESGISTMFYFYLILIFNLIYFFWLTKANISGWLLLSLFFAIGSLPGFWLMRYFLRKRWLFILSLLLVCFEYIRVCTDYTLPFQIIGYTQWNVYPVLQLAALGGVWLVSFFVYSCNLLVFSVLNQRRLRWFWLLVLLSLLVLAAVWHQPKPERTIKIALIQTNLRLDQIGDNDELFWDAYTQACLKAAIAKPELYIWPEVALHKSLREDRESARRLRDILSQLNAGIILGNRDAHSFGLRFNNNYNAVFYIDRYGVVQGTHYKQKLIPFMETVNQDLAMLPYFIRNRFQAGIYRKGRDRNLLQISPKLHVAGLICFEAVDGRYVTEFTRQKPGFIVNVSSDGWSRSLTEHELNLHFNIFRAVESRLYLVRVAEDGISAVISPRGDILAMLPAFTSGNIVWDVPY